MRRRDFLATVAASSLSAPAAASAEGLSTGSTAPDDRIPELAFDSTSSLLDASGGQLSDESVVAVWAGEDATNTDTDENGDAVSYDGDVPLVAVDGDVVGFGEMLVDDDRNRQYGNEEFVLNAWDEHVGGGTVLWDEGHGQFYDLGKFRSFANYAEDDGYTVEGTENLAADLPGADGLVITSPSEPFSDAELEALSSFLADGGALFLHDQSDFRDFDETANLDEVADHLDLPFRFNDDQVVDPGRNAGNDFQPVTDRFTDVAEPYLEDREGLGLDPDRTYTVDVTRVSDGDTIGVEFDDGRTESIRILGVDSPETSQNQQHERSQEWEGLEDMGYLARRADEATAYAEDLLADATVELSFDENEAVRDQFGRVLGYVRYDDGSRLFNRDLIEDGHARVYGSGFARHDEFRRIEEQARQAGRGMWAESDPENSPEVRNDEFDELFLPTPGSVRTRWGEVDDDRVPLYASETATQDLEEESGGWWSWWYSDAVRYDDIPLAAVDESSRVAVVGSPIVDEDYEIDEDYPVDTAGFGNFPFLTNLIDYLSDLEGDVAIDGGHGQFNADFALSNDDAAYYQRYLEGLGMAFEQFNEITREKLVGYRAVIVTTPTEEVDWTVASELREFARDGGAVVLLGAGGVGSTARENLNDLASRLDTDLRLNADEVRDESNNVDGDPSVITTGSFDESFPLFSPYSDDDDDDDGGETCDEVVESSHTGRLAGWDDSDAFRYTAETDSPCETTVSLSGPADADFDLYVTFDGRTPSVYDYDKRSWNFGSEEEIVASDEEFDGTDDMGILVHSYIGAGEYTLVVEETGTGRRT